MDDEQDLAEVFDETNTTEDGDDIAHPDMAPNVFDVTREGEDSDEDETPDDDFDPDTASDDELDMILERDDGVDDDEPAGPDDAGRVTTEDGDPSDYESASLSDDDLIELGYEDTAPDRQDARLDEGLEETFPASDPVSISPGAD